MFVHSSCCAVHYDFPEKHRCHFLSEGYNIYTNSEKGIRKRYLKPQNMANAIHNYGNLKNNEAMTNSM